MNINSFFSLSDDPFRLTPDEGFFFPTRGHVAVKDVVQHTIEMGEGIVVVLGEPGTGKTLLLRMLLRELPGRETVLVVTPSVSPEDLLRIVIHDLTGEEASGANKAQLLQELFSHLEGLAAQGKGLLIAIDEAQHTPPETLEQLRLVTNFETARRKIVQLLLVGQPELSEILKAPLLRPFAQRISVVEHLTPLARSEVEEYVRFRLNRAGGGTVSFDRKAIDALFEASGGIPRMINKIAARAMFLAYANKTRKIGRELVHDALATMDLDPRGSTSRKPGATGKRWAWAGLAAAAGTAAFFWVALQGGWHLPLNPKHGSGETAVAEADQTPSPPHAASEKDIPLEKRAKVANFTSTPPPATGRKVVVTSNLAHVRRGPGLEYPHVCYVRRGDEVSVLDRREDWLLVNHRVDDLAYCKGWISASVIREERGDGNTNPE